jgi:hypothetical protein
MGTLPLSGLIIKEHSPGKPTPSLNQGDFVQLLLELILQEIMRKKETQIHCNFGSNSSFS